jgi:hypothetical protein
LVQPLHFAFIPLLKIPPCWCEAAPRAFYSDINIKAHLCVRP